MHLHKTLKIKPGFMLARWSCLWAPPAVTQFVNWLQQKVLLFLWRTTWVLLSL